MMRPDKKAKWIVGITGTALSAFILSQLDMNPTSEADTQSSQQLGYQTEDSAEDTVGLSDREIELATKDWTNFTVEFDGENPSAVRHQPVNPPADRNTSRS